MTDDDPIQFLRDQLDRVVEVKVPSIIRRGELSTLAGHEDERVPLSARDKISQLESYLLLTAEARQLAHQCQVAASDEVFRCDREMEEGWEQYLTGSRSKATGPQVAAAKKRAHPETFKRRERVDWLVRRFGEQIRRLEQDDEVASRVYTLITGG